MASQHRNGNSKSRNGGGKGVGKGSNSLFGRVGNSSGQNPVLQKKQTLERAEKAKAEKAKAKTGLTFLGGKLVLAADLQGNKMKASSDKNKQQIQSNKRVNLLHNLKNRARSKQRNNSDNSNNKKLVISLKESLKCLKIRNLPIGTNPSNLQRVLQQMGNCKVTDLKVIDLPTGSAHAELFASNMDLETLHKRFNQAEIDGRRILTEISSQPEL